MGLRDGRRCTRNQQEHSLIKLVLIRILKIWKGHHVCLTARGLSYFLFQLSNLGMVISMVFLPMLGTKSQLTPNCVSKSVQ